MNKCSFDIVNIRYFHKSPAAILTQVIGSGIVPYLSANIYKKNDIT